MNHNYFQVHSFHPFIIHHLSFNSTWRKQVDHVIIANSLGEVKEIIWKSNGRGKNKWKYKPHLRKFNQSVVKKYFKEIKKNFTPTQSTNWLNDWLYDRLTWHNTCCSLMKCGLIKLFWVWLRNIVCMLLKCQWLTLLVAVVVGVVSGITIGGVFFGQK